VLAASAGFVLACSVYTEDLLLNDDGHGGSSANGTGTATATGTTVTTSSGQTMLPDGSACGFAADCQSGFCVDGVCCNSPCTGVCEACNLSPGSCVPVASGQDPADECAGADNCNGQGVCLCSDNQQNGGETDLDCGGPNCGPCELGKNCEKAGDCDTSVCTAGVCANPSCTDMVKNGGETGIDCGGTCPNGCMVGEGCEAPSDCVGGICTGMQCQSPACGDGNPGGAGEDCDDNNTEPFDGCSPACLDPVNHLIISEIVVIRTEAEFVEIYNPTSQNLPLEQIYLADYKNYYDFSSGPSTLFDFRVRFPAGASIAPGSFATVSLETASAFQTVYGKYPDYDFDAADGNAPAMVGDFTGSSGLTNSGEVVVLFRWDGVSDLVEDIDYLLYGTPSSGVDKTGVSVGGSSYVADTPVASQGIATTPDTDGESLHRCDTAEATETKLFGNGPAGHDETSEDSSVAWKVDVPSPGAPPTLGLCP
jgi:hypothetical protein